MARFSGLIGLIAIVLIGLSFLYEAIRHPKAGRFLGRAFCSFPLPSSF